MFEVIRDFCLQQGFQRTYWVALSGGLDSCVLLHLLQELRSHFPIQLHAIHVHHGLHPHAHDWARFCASLCHAYDVPYTEKSIQMTLEEGESLEEIAREKRYAVFAKHLAFEDILLTAHQQNDQAETVLLQLFRGAGLQGLAAMPFMKPFAKGFHARPLLSFSRAHLELYAKTKELKWVEDESNLNIQFTRNFIRHEVVPLLKTRWPSITETISRSASHCAEAKLLLDESMIHAYQDAKGSKEKTLSVMKLLQLDPLKRKYILRMWMKEQNIILPNTKKMETLLKDILMAARDRMPCIRFKNGELRRYQDDLYLMKSLLSHDIKKTFSWDFKEPLCLSSVGVLRATFTKGGYFSARVSSAMVRFRQGGEVLSFVKNHRTLKNLFQEWRIPPWERHRIPLIFVEEELVSVVGYFISERYKANQDEMGYEFVLESLEHPPTLP